MGKSLPLKIKMLRLWFLLILMTIIVSSSLLLSQDLWVDNKNIFSDSDSLSIGNIVHIEFREPFIISYRSRVSQLINQNKPSPTISSDLLNFLPQFTFSKNQTANSDKSIEANLNLQGSLAAIIISYNTNNKTYIVEARRSITINYKPTTIALRGLVNTKDIIGGKINSKKIANAQISYAGYVTIKNTNISQANFNNLFTKPSTKTNGQTNGQTNQTPTPVLTEETKRRLFIEFFNLFLSELF